MTQAVIHDARRCELGEGLLWHPQRRQLFWFDILNQRLLSQDRDGPRVWKFPEMVSAAGWVSRDVLLIAGERDLFLFDLETEEIEPLCLLEADKPGNRSNDGRADRQGGFWIGTMAKNPDNRAGMGAIYRFYRGELRLLYPGITIPNAMCFSRDGKTAHFTDTTTGKVMRVALDASGWPSGPPEVYLDLTAEGFHPDGAVIDAAGNMWLAHWGVGQIACYAPDGTRLSTNQFDAPNTTCPAFGGESLSQLFCTTAMEHLDAAARLASPQSGMVFATTVAAQGLAEPQVIL